MNRRDFVAHLGYAAGSAVAWQAPGPVQSLLSDGGSGGSVFERRADVVVIGAGVGGVAAALAAVRTGSRVILTEETNWIGGQLTQQAVPPDEHPWIEQFGASASYMAFRRRVRAYYEQAYPLSSASSAPLNPGNCGVSRICHEPRAALAVLESMLAPYVSSGRLLVLLEHVPIQASVSGDFVESVRVLNRRSGEEVEVVAPTFIDATELGDLLPLTGTEYVTGTESVAQTGEPHAADEPQPHNMQAATWCFAMDFVQGEDHTIEEPDEYRFWREYVPNLTPPWPGRLLNFTYSNPMTLEPRTLPFDPRTDADQPGWWSYRRLIDPSNFVPGTFDGGITLVNWPQNDYLLGNFLEVDDAERERHLDRARQLSLSLFYWLQTEAPRPDGGAGWPGLRLRGDLTGTTHGLAKRPYIREARRIRAEFTVLEQHVGLEARMEETGLDEGEVTAASFHDSVGVGSYRIDLHPSTGGDNYIDIGSLPFEIPLGALIPQRMENVLPACKNIGTTHITNGCYRLHPVEWNIGEAAGALAAFCDVRGVVPRQVRGDDDTLADFQRSLQRQGVEIRWPDPARMAR
ncbi:MAG: FAD-dependent oxidoreductase [Rhodothermales bacterium]